MDGKTLIPKDSEIKFVMELESHRNSGWTYQKCCDHFNALGLLNRKENVWETGNLSRVYKKWISEGKDRYSNLIDSASTSDTFVRV